MTHDRSWPSPSRRHFLRGVGVALALPWLESVPAFGQGAAKAAAKANSEPAAENDDPAAAYAAPKADADPEEIKAKQQRQVTAAIVGAIVFVVAAVVLNFWTPYRSEQLGIGVLGGATAAGAGLLAGLIAYPFVSGKK